MQISNTLSRWLVKWPKQRSLLIRIEVDQGIPSHHGGTAMVIRSLGADYRWNFNLIPFVTSLATVGGSEWHYQRSWRWKNWSTDDCARRCVDQPDSYTVTGELLRKYVSGK